MGELSAAGIPETEGAPRLGGPLPSLEPGETLLRFTSSLCPYCERVVPAAIVEKEGKVFIKKECPEHGPFEDLYFGDAELYKKFSKFEEEGRGTLSYVSVKAPCPFSCGLCSMHRNHTALLNVVVTNRCSLSCWYCFFYSEASGYVYEPPIEQIVEQVKLVAKQGKPVAVQLTGGEPLLRDDLAELVAALKKVGVTHVQLNVTGVGFAEVYWRDPTAAAAWVRELREAGVNTVYLSFDGVTPKTNPKNHWEVPFVLEALRRGGLTSVVLVPTVIKGYNDHELGDIVKFAALHMDVVRGVNFQPISLTGRMKKYEVERHRITIPDVIKEIEKQTEGQIGRDAWYPVPAAAKFAKLVEAITGKEQFFLANHVACGAATYVFVERDGGGSFAFRPLTEFFDVEGFLSYADELYERLREAGKLRRAYEALKLLAKLRQFVKRDKLPNGESLTGLVAEILRKRSYEALGKLHYSSLFIGIMHFMDLYNYDVQRVMRCNIHYATPDGRVVPFCAYNVLSDVYRDSLFKKHGVPLSEWAKVPRRPHKYGVSEKHKRDPRALEKHPLYLAAYRLFLDKLGQ